MNNDLVIVFVKNIELGKVKTRLAKTIGNQAAFDVYKQLVHVTETETKKLDIATHIYFSEDIVDNQWSDCYKTVQQGVDLGERMKNAFQNGFKNGYKRIVLIGSDLPDISTKHILKGLQALDHSEVVFGPAEDGGYYLLGMSKMNVSVFENKPWSQPYLLEETLQELHKHHISVSTLETLNDIDTYDDLIASEFYKNNIVLQQKIEQPHD